MTNIPILVDGPNYVNRVMELGIDSMHIARQLSLAGLMEVVNERIIEFPHITGCCESVEFICSKKRFGPEKKRFNETQHALLIDRLRAETGVYVDIIDIPGPSEKGVDMTISGKLEEFASDADAVVLVSADRDFIPTLKKLRHKIKVILVALSDSYPVDLQNEAYSTLFLYEDYRGLFKYHYPRFSIKDLNQQKCSELFCEADDRVSNQVRGSYDGYVYVSKKTGAEELYDVKFRWETFRAYNGYVGPMAASDQDYVKEELKEIQLAWKRDAKGYIDLPVDVLWPEKDNS
ncbi:MAG: NYN domain-containing protein [Thermodesulfovibrionales bacterium]